MAKERGSGGSAEFWLGLQGQSSEQDTLPPASSDRASSSSTTLQSSLCVVGASPAPALRHEGVHFGSSLRIHLVTQADSGHAPRLKTGAELLHRPHSPWGATVGRREPYSLLQIPSAIPGTAFPLALGYKSAETSARG